jgi:hypothetical protein
MQLRVILALIILATAVSAVQASGNKSDVVVAPDVALGTVNVLAAKCYHKQTLGFGLTSWQVCPQLFQKLDGSDKQFFMYIVLSTAATFTRASVTINIDGNVQSSGDIDWTYGNGGKFAHIPITRDYLERLKAAHDVYFILQLPGVAARNDVHLDDKGLKTLQAACDSVLNYAASK